MPIAKHSELSDVDEIFKLYRTATQLMREKGVTPWPDFDRNMVISELRQKRQFKFLVDQSIACVWAVTYSDPEIWGDRNDDPAIYIHRIATNPKYRGRGFVSHIVEWAKKQAESKHFRFIRMDTVGENRGLISHYGKHGFDFLGLSKLEFTDNLPEHYYNATVSLFQIDLNAPSQTNGEQSSGSDS